jgi:hypothetical protein
MKEVHVSDASVFAGDAPWADYYLQMWPGYKEATSGYQRWKYGSSALNMTRDAWESRERARVEWIARHGDDVSRWPMEHPPVIIWQPLVYMAACLGCTWIEATREGRSDLEVVARWAREHSISHGGEVDVVNEHRVSVFGRVGGGDIAPTAWEA